MPEPQRAKPRLSDQTRARLGWWLPPVLAVCAIVFQYAFDVPKAAMVPRPSGEEKKAEEAAKRKKLREMNRERVRETKRWTGRSADQVMALRREWLTQAIEDEPRDPRFRKHHEAVLRSAVSKARAKALDDNDAIAIQIRPSCYTIRCALELCGPDVLIDDIADYLPQVKVAPLLGPAGPLFLEQREVPPKSRPARRGRKDHKCRRWLVTFDRDNTELRDLKLD